jgi:hypothetical protein
VICVVPADTPVAKPVDELMVATPVALLAQVKVTPPMVLPLLSFAVAVNCSVAPAAMDGEDGVTAMLATTGVTVSVSGALVTPCAAAVICVVPADTPVARPVDELMVATPVALLAQVKVTPLMVLPLLSFAVAVNCSDAPVAMDGEAEVTAMLASTGLLGGVVDPEEPPPQPA